MRIALSLACLSAVSAAQITDTPFAKRVDWTTQRGPFANPSADAALVDSFLLREPNAPALRLFFTELELGEGDWLDLTSTYDGSTQRLRAEHTHSWQSSSAWFNGDGVLVELWAAPGSAPAWEGAGLLIGLENVATPGDTICGPDDDRVASSDDRVARFLNSSGTSACTGWLGPAPCAFTAGHCVPTYGHLAEWHVPPSTSTGALQHPPPEFQFPIDMSSIQGVNGGVGNDYALTRIFPNTLGEDPHVKFPHFTMGFFLPSGSDVIRITGYGSDSGVDDQVQQTHFGPFAGSSGAQLQYQADTTGGNSGSPVIHEATQQAVGIHTHGGCGSGGGANSGTSITHGAFQSLYFSNCDPQPPTALIGISDTTPLAGQTVQFTDNSLGVPLSWQWDFDGDGTVDSTQQNPSHEYAVAGTYDVSLTVSNGLGSDSIVLSGGVIVSPLIPSAPEISEAFDGGLPSGAAWTFFSSNEFGAIVGGGSGSASPGSGDPALTMSSNTEGQYVLNEVTLHLHMTGATSGLLRYWGKETSDEADPEDGLFLSDGTTEIQAVDHTSGYDSWVETTVDLVALANANGLELGNDFRVIWRQYDNYDLGTDGFLIDDVSVESDAPHLNASAPLVSASAGGSVDLVLNSSAAFGGDLFLVLGSQSGVAPALPFGSALLPLVADDYTNFTLASANAGPFSNSFGSLDGSGRAKATIQLPANSSPVLAGMVLYHAALGFEPSNGSVVFATNATQLGITL